jgi:hypothetical protein
LEKNPCLCVFVLTFFSGQRGWLVNYIGEFFIMFLQHLKYLLDWHAAGFCYLCYGAFTLDVKSMSNENLSGIQGGTQC